MISILPTEIYIITLSVFFTPNINWLQTMNFSTFSGVIDCGRDHYYQQKKKKGQNVRNLSL